jgi:hypothetical protein
MEALGRLFNIAPTAADTVNVKMKDCSAVTFVCVGADTYTLSETKAGASSQVLATLDHVYENANANGSTAWTRRSVLSGGNQVSAVTTAAAVAVFTVEDAELSDGFTHLKVVSTGAGLVIAIAHDLTVQRAPQNLPALAV